MPAPEEPDEILIARALEGDKEALNTLFKRYEEHIKSIIRPKVPPDDVNDIAQLVFEQALKSLSSITEKERFKNWLSKVARNKVYDHLRTLERTRPLLESLNTSCDGKEADEPSVPGHENHITERDFYQKAIKKLRQSLPVKHLRCLFLNAHGLSHEEIASRVDIGVKSVPVYIHQARKKARKILAQMIQEQEGDE